ncbi:acetyl-CoA C-acetyltransferase [Microbacterium alcoholitolerans]|uniref:acetyl-CoA C-acetyltransferase n=1 Tax=unclassified Microbacterium TaxID=2609290 RepID=UPI003D181596
MTTAYIVEVVRTPVGRRGGGLAEIHPADLASYAITALIDRSGVDPALVDDVILGCIDNVGPQAGCIARTAWLAAGFPTHVPGVTLDRQCGSSQQSVHFAAQAVMSGTADLIVAGGVQNMSMIPMGTAAALGPQLRLDDDPFVGSEGWRARYGDQPVSQFHGAEEIARRWDISREEMEKFALESHRRAIAATDEGRFDGEIAPIRNITKDEGPRRDTSLERMAGLAPLREGGRLTAALASQISDGASAVLVASERAVKEYGLRPLVKVRELAVVGSDPILMLTGPIPASRRVLERAGLRIDDIGVAEINEAFASVVLAWQRELGGDLDRVNVNGGAIALGHPIGASGTRLMTTLISEMRRTGSQFGLQSMCEGGGQANATILELVD